MISLITAFHSKQFKTIILSLVALIAFAIPAAAQHGLSLSNQADFSTSDRLFIDGETIHIMVEPGAEFDAASVTESSFEVKPTRDGEEYEGTLALQNDGSFTGSVEVAALEGSSTAWRLRVKIEDEFNHEYEARTAIVIRGRADHPDVFRVSGTVETATNSEITVGGRNIAVTADTKLHTSSEIAIADLGGHDVIVSVQREADETLTALQIFVTSEQDATIDFVGRIQSVGDASIEIQGVAFAVNEQTVIASGSGESLALSSLRPRMFVRIEAQHSEDGWIATSITARMGGEDDDDDVEEDEVEGTIQEKGDGFIVVAGMQLDVSDRTEIRGVERFDDLEVDMQVEVEFVTTEAGAFVATKIEVEEGSSGEDGEEIEVEGLITALGEMSITVEGIEFTITADTEIKGGGHEGLTFADLATGLQVEVEGVVRDGETIAEKIDVDDDENHTKLRGEITAIGEGTATVGAAEFHVTEATSIRGERGTELTFEDLEIGMHAKVHLVEGEDGTLTALRIKVKQPFEDDDVEITGRIEAVSSTEITVRDHTFTITADTEIENDDGDEIGALDLSAGMVAKVEGTMIDGALVATEIKVHTQVHQEGRFAGLVTGIGTDSFEVNGVEFNVTLDTILEGADVLSDISLGTRVKLRYRRLGDGTRLALRVQVKTDTEAEAAISGAIEEIDGDAIVVAGVVVTTTALTKIEDEDRNEITFADLEVGQSVEVEGTAAAGGILATKIKIEDDVVVSGAVSAQAESSVQLAGMTFVIDGETLIIGRNNALLSVGDLTAGAYVEVIATADAAAGKNGSTLTAERVLVVESTTTSTAADDDGLPGSFVLGQNYPNPFNPTTNITFELNPSAAGHVSLAIYNILGQRIATLVDGALSAGTYTYQWNGHDDIGRAAASGIYLYRLSAGEQTATRSMILTK